MVQDAVHHHPGHLHQSNPPEVSSSPLWYQGNRLPRTFLGQRPIMERYLHDGNDLLTVSGIRCVVLSRSSQPLLGVFRSHP